MKNVRYILLGLLALVVVYNALSDQFGFQLTGGGGPSTEDVLAASIKDGIVTMLDLGSVECVPCKMMAPIIEELRSEYEGRASIVLIDVRKQRKEARKYGIRAIPTQIFFDEYGSEVHRHVGFMDKKSIIQALERMGVQKKAP